MERQGWEECEGKCSPSECTEVGTCGLNCPITPPLYRCALTGVNSAGSLSLMPKTVCGKPGVSGPPPPVSPHIPYFLPSMLQI